MKKPCKYQFRIKNKVKIMLWFCLIQKLATKSKVHVKRGFCYKASFTLNVTPFSQVMATDNSFIYLFILFNSTLKLALHCTLDHRFRTNQMQVRPAFTLLRKFLHNLQWKNTLNHLNITIHNKNNSIRSTTCFRKARCSSARELFSM